MCNNLFKLSDSLDTVVSKIYYTPGCTTFSWQIWRSQEIEKFWNQSLKRKEGEISQAEYLESLLPKSANVIKAFNVLSAYALESGGIQGKRNVLFIWTLFLNLKDSQCAPGFFNPQKKSMDFFTFILQVYMRQIRISWKNHLSSSFQNSLL